ncbi:MAG TPA: DNA-processing protein DprA [Epsilonproteobacteria bacterium]|nr:DNA-processing protein DprA [Campylobacterota bacterium]
MQKVENPSEIIKTKKPPSTLFYKGSLELLKRPRVSIVGARKPSLYTQNYTFLLAKALSKRGVCIVSGAAMGVDAIAHKGAGAENTIAVVGNGLDIRYPSINRDLIEEIEKSGLVLSQFEEGFKPTKWSFVLRNELVVALGDILIVAQANLDSGSMRSVAYAQEQSKEIFVLPHQLGESQGTNGLLASGDAKAIWDIDQFASLYGDIPSSDGIKKDDFFYFCQQNPTLDETILLFQDRVYEAELLGEIVIENGRVRLA